MCKEREHQVSCSAVQIAIHNIADCKVDGILDVVVFDLALILAFGDARGFLLVIKAGRVAEIAEVHFANGLRVRLRTKCKRQSAD